MRDAAGRAGAGSPVPAGADRPARAADEPSTLAKAWRLARPFWRSELRWRALGLLAATVAITLGMVWLEVRLNAWHGAFYDALQAKDQAAFWRLMLVFCGLAAAFVAAAVWRQWLRQLLQLRWREWMTARLSERWLADGAHHRLRLAGRAQDNPDQRIADDVAAFVADTLALGLGLLGSVVTLVSFASILWTLSGTLHLPLPGGTSVALPGHLVWAALAYAALGSWLTQRVGRPLPALQFEQQRVEADYRFGLARVREHGEAIALQRGGAAEAAAAARRFAAVAANALRVMRRQKGLTGLTSGYAQAAVVFPYLAAAPRYFAGGLTLGSLMQSASAFGQVQGALSWFVDAYAAIAAWRATVDRLWGFERALAELGAAPTGPTLRRGAADGLCTRGVRLALPDGRPLAPAPALRLRPGEWLLLEGPSGAGKSTLLRAIAGAWPHGEGEVELPPEPPMVVPQTPYLPTGTLREALAWPGDAAALGDDEARAMLAEVGLDVPADGLDRAEAWQQRLSPGEQQRLALARVLRTRPRLLLMDEATSALDPDGEARLLRLLRERLPEAAVLSVGHRPSLRAHHDRRVTLAGRSRPDDRDARAADAPLAA